MSKKFNRALKGLKDTYPTPDPEREAEFLRNLPEQKPEKKRIPLLHTGNRSFWYGVPAVVTAVVLITAGTGIYQRVSQQRLPSVKPPAETQTTTTTVTVPTEDPLSAPSSEASDATEATRGHLSSVPESTQTSVSGEYTDMTEYMGTEVTTAPSDADGFHEESHMPQTDVSERTESPMISTTAASASAGSNSNTTVDRSTTQAAQTTRTTTTDDAVQSPSPDTDDEPGYMTTMPEPPTENNAGSTEWEEPSEPVPPMDDIPDVDPVPSVTVPEPTDSAEPEPPVDVQPTEPPSAGSQEESRDLTVMPFYRHTVTETIVQEEPIDGDSFQSGLSSLDYIAWKNLADASDVIIRGSVVNRIYTRAQGDAYTQLTVYVFDTYKGDLHPNDQISVYEEGGYMLLADYLSFHPIMSAAYANYDPDATSIHISPMGTTASRLGDSFVMFLNLSENENIPTGAYVYVHGAEWSRFTLRNNVLSCMAEKGDTLTLTELTDYLNS